MNTEQVMDVGTARMPVRRTLQTVDGDAPLCGFDGAESGVKVGITDRRGIGSFAVDTPRRQGENHTEREDDEIDGDAHDGAG